MSNAEKVFHFENKFFRVFVEVVIPKVDGVVYERIDSETERVNLRFRHIRVLRFRVLTFHVNFKSDLGVLQFRIHVEILEFRVRVRI